MKAHDAINEIHEESYGCSSEVEAHINEMGGKYIHTSYLEDGDFEVYAFDDKSQILVNLDDCTLGVRV